MGPLLVHCVTLTSGVDWCWLMGKPQGTPTAGNEKRLIKKCRELNAEIVANAAKVQTALKLSEEDQMTISSLKKEVEKAWKMVDASHEKEARAKETICQLKLEITNLTRLVEQGAGISLGEEATVNDLLKQKEELAKELDSKVRLPNTTPMLSHPLPRFVCVARLIECTCSTYVLKNC